MKSSLMRINLIFILLVLFVPNLTSAETKTFIKEYTYQASEFDSRASGRALALEQIKRLLLEELGIYLESNTEVKNYQLTKDQITTLTAGIVGAEVIDEKWDGKTYYLKAKLLADPKEVAQSINELRQDKQRTKELEDIRKKSDEQVKEIARLKKELEKDQATSKEPSGKADAKKVEKYTNAVTKLTAKDWLLKGLMLDSSRTAIQAYDRAIELDPEYEEAYLHRAKVYLDLSTNYQRAIDDINNSIKYEPHRRRDGKYGSLAEKYSIRAKAYSRLEDYEKAFKDLELAISLDYTKALFLLYPIKWNEKEFEDFVNKFPNDYRVFMFRGIFVGGGFGIKGSDVIVQTIADYKKALDLNPNSAICKYLLGIAYDSFLYELRSLSVSEYSAVVGDISKVTLVMFCTQALQLKPSQELRFQIYATRSNAYWRAGNYEKSIEDISRAIEINPEYAEGYRSRAYAYNKLGKYRAAIEDYDVAIRLKSASVEYSDRVFIAAMYIYRGDNYSEIGEYVRAVENYSTGIEIYTKELLSKGKDLYAFDYYYKRSKAYEQLGRYQQAKKDFREGVKLTFDEKDANSSFEQGRRFDKLDQEYKGVDYNYKEEKIKEFKIAAILGHKKAQAWLKERGIEW